MIQHIRQYENAFEMAVQTGEDEESISGWSDIILKDTELLKLVSKMAKNADNAEGKKIALMLCKHPKESVRWLSNKIMADEKFEVEDRSTITL